MLFTLVDSHHYSQRGVWVFANVTKEDVRSLIEDLEGSGGWGKGRKTREKAAMKLGLHGGEEAVLPLIEAFATNHHAPIWPWSSHERGYEGVYARSLLNVVIRSIEEQIVELGFGDSVKVELGTEDPHADGERPLYRDYSVEISPTEVSGLVSMMMGHDDPMVRIGGALIFGECDFYEGPPYPSALFDERFCVLGPIHPIDYSSIIEAFADEDPRVRWAACHALRREQIKQPDIIWDTPVWTPWTDAIPSLVQALDDPETRKGCSVPKSTPVKSNPRSMLGLSMTSQSRCDPSYPTLIAEWFWPLYSPWENALTNHSRSTRGALAT